MKVFVATAIGLSALSPFLCSAALIKSKIKTSEGAAFGPQNCVTLTRSSGGSCVMTTDCEGADLTQTVFAFDCVKKSGEIVRHSFGTGGFEPSEEFDTQEMCDRCESTSDTDVAVKTAAKAPVKPAAPAPEKVVKVPQAAPAPVVPQTAPAPVVFKAKVRQSAQSQVTTKATATTQSQFWPFTSSESSEKSAEPEVVKYGPNGCVSTWRSSDAHCVMRTNCKGQDISKYEFGLVCVDKVGSPVRHLFGLDSFDSEETFDTLIKCDKCLGLEDIPDGVALNGEVVTLSKDISNLKDVMKNISINVEMLNEEVFKKKESKAAGPAPAPAPAASAPAAALVHQSSAITRTSDSVQADQNVRKHNLRHSQKKQRQYDDDEDSQDEDEESSEEDTQEPVVSDDQDDGSEEDED